MSYKKQLVDHAIATESPLATRESWQVDMSARNRIGIVVMSNIIEPLGINDLAEFDTPRAYNALLNSIQGNRNSGKDEVDIDSHVIDIRQSFYAENSPKAANPFLERGTVEPVDARPYIMADPKVRQFIDGRDFTKEHAELVGLWSSFKKALTEGIQNGIALGYIPADVNNRVASALTQTAVRLVDPAILDTYGPKVNGIYLTVRDEVGLRHGVHGADGNSESVLIHEFIHKISGGTFTADTSGTPLSHERTRTGFSNILAPERISKPGLNEALTQHVTLGIQTGDFETVDPDKRIDGDKIYFGYRKLLADFIDKSHGSIDSKTMIQAFFEDSGEEGNTTARRAFVGQVAHSYNAGTLVLLEELFTASKLVDHKDVGKILGSRIHPPEIDELGRIIKRGYIDTENLMSYVLHYDEL